MFRNGDRSHPGSKYTSQSSPRPSSPMGRDHKLRRSLRTPYGLPAALLAAALTLGPGAVRADDFPEIPFDEAELFFELNNTDGDLGIHALIDGDAWKKLEIEDVRERTILKVKASGRLRRQGLTEIFFESAEPTFDELSPAQFFRRFPEGIYEIEGKTIEGEELESEVELTHVMPAPADITVNGQPAAEDCDVCTPHRRTPTRRRPACRSPTPPR